MASNRATECTILRVARTSGAAPTRRGGGGRGTARGRTAPRGRTCRCGVVSLSNSRRSWAASGATVVSVAGRWPRGWRPAAGISSRQSVVGSRRSAVGLGSWRPADGCRRLAVGGRRWSLGMRSLGWHMPCGVLCGAREHPRACVPTGQSRAGVGTPQSREIQNRVGPPRYTILGRAL